MFRDLYKQANEEIKGDKLIIEKVFQKAAVPVKKTPVFRYSFVGTCAAAVLIFGVVFMNSELFTDKSFVSETIPTEQETLNESVGICDEPAVFSRRTDTPVENSAVKESVVADTNPKKVTVQEESKTKEENSAATAQAAEIDVVSDMAGEGGIAVWSMNRVESEEDSETWTDADDSIMLMSEEYDSDDDVWSESEWTEDVTEPENIVVAPSSAGGGSKGEPDEADGEDEADGVKTEVSTFSYMYDKSIYAEGEPGVKTEGFVNTDVSPVANEEEAIERAKNECTVEYDTTLVSFDPIENIWKVNFSMSDTEGEDESVYMNSDGITQLIVYGE